MREVLAPGRNCWRVSRASRVTFLVDAAAYFDVLGRASLRARHSIAILGWDFDSRTHLWPRRRGRRAVEVGRLLRTVVERRPDLHVRILGWDYSLLYAFERELLPALSADLRGHPRLELQLDARHPPGGSHHQKVVVIDDALAFVGGIDVTSRRWDTPEHRPRDSRRVDPGGARYAPFHDVQVAVEGPVAGVLGTLARERWRRATGREVPAAPAPERTSPWPDGLGADLTDVDVAVARTLPEQEGQPAVREIAHLLLDTIAAAERFLYFENQFLTSHAVATALAASLARPRGPEIVIVVPGHASGWLEEATMSVLRARVLRDLRAADRHGRLHVLFPSVDHGRVQTNLHDKVLVADDQLCCAGSANLTNRSLALDSECDLVLEAPAGPDGERVRGAIAAFRRRLLAEHLGAQPAAVAAAEEREGSVMAAIERAGRGERRLEELAPSHYEHEDLLPDSSVIDPVEPLDAEHILAALLPEPVARAPRRPLLELGALLVALLALAVAWHFTPLGESLDAKAMLESASGWGRTPLAPLVTLAVFVVGGLVLVPLTVMVIETGLVFGPVLGAVYALAGALASAAVSYGLGRVAGRAALERLVTSRLRGLARPLGRRTIFVVAAVRLVPVAPYAIVNAAFGAAQTRFRYFMAGTLLGMSPGVLALAIFGYQLRAALTSPTGWSFAVLAVIAGGIVALGIWLRRRLVARTVENDAEP